MPEKATPPTSATTLVTNRPPGRSAIGDDELPGPGATLAGKYELVRPLGRGGMGVVMEARDLRLGRRVAIKMISPGVWQTPELVARFEREARAAARLQSPHAVRLLDVDVAKPAVPFMVMEYLEGRALDAELRERGPLPVAEAVTYVLEACEAMSEAHGAGIIHRDLKPSNLFVCRAGGRRTLKVLDFGISKLTDERERAITQTRSAFGTPEYMAPEQVRALGTVDARSDVWSLGVVLYQLLAGATPFAGETASAVFVAIVTDSPPPLRPLRPDVPVELEFVLSRALRKKPAERFPSALAFAEALAPFAEPAARLPSGGAFDATAPAPPRPPSGEAFDAGAAQVLSRPARPPPGRLAGSPFRPSPAQRLGAIGLASASLGVAVVWFGWGANYVRQNGVAPAAPSAAPSPPARADAAPAVAPITAAVAASLEAQAPPPEPVEAPPPELAGAERVPARKAPPAPRARSSEAAPNAPRPPARPTPSPAAPANPLGPDGRPERL